MISKTKPVFALLAVVAFGFGSIGAAQAGSTNCGNGHSGARTFNKPVQARSTSTQSLKAPKAYSARKSTKAKRVSK